MKNPFDSPYVMSWRDLHAHYIEHKRRVVSTWTEFCRYFDQDPKTVKAVRDKYGIHESVGPKAEPSPDFHTSDDYFLGEGI